jgi:transposase IS66 family protein/papain fold toxin 2 of polymorphic toxin system
LRYARNQRVALRRFIDDGRLPAHNNITELNLRRQVFGRRNWLFVGTDDGALANTTFVSLLVSARLHDIEPHGYIRDLLCLIRTWPPDRLLKLAPVNWKQTLEQAETQQKLPTSFDASRFRRLPELAIAQRLYGADRRLAMTGQTEPIHFIARDLVGAGTSLTQNGFHQAVRVGDMVFDNFLRKGVCHMLSTWVH